MPIKTLIENLSDQVELHAVLMESLEIESELPASCSLQELEDLHSVRDMAVQNIVALEKVRMAVIENYQASFELKGSINLTDIIERCPEGEKTQLIELREQLKRLMGTIQKLSKKIAGRAVARMACFNEVQGNMQKAFKRIPTYSMKGILNRPKGAYFVKRSI